MKRDGMLRWVVLLSALCLLSTAAGGEPAQKPDIQILVVDTLRADRLATYGASRSTDPNLKRFAEKAVVFEQNWATASWTLPSTASVLTGTYPTVHGVRAKKGEQASVFTIRAGVVTLAEVLREQGYHTIALVANFWLEPHHGLDRGFDHYWLSRIPATDASILHSKAQALMEEVPDGKPVFLYLHYLDVHAPYDPYFANLEPLAPEIAERELTRGQWGRVKGNLKRHGVQEQTLGFVVDAYDKGIRRWDRDFGAWLEWLEQTGRLERTVMSITSDHGEEFLDHGKWMHGNSLFEEQLWVPWVLYAPGLAPARVQRPTSIVDVAPTVLRFAGAPIPRSMLGVAQVRSDRVALIEADPDRAVFAEMSSDGGGEWRDMKVRAARRQSQKVLRGNRGHEGYLFYDLDADPDEVMRRPASDEMVKLLDDLEKAYEEMGATVGESNEVEMPDDLKERLRALGYDLD